MTPVALSRFFKLRTGKTVTDYIIDIRLGHATRFLVDTTNTITEFVMKVDLITCQISTVFSKKKRGVPQKNFEKITGKQNLLFNWLLVFKGTSVLILLNIKLK